MSYHVHLTPKSKNAKTGPIPVSTTTALTCPGTCPFNHQNAGGCYAESGPLALHWRKVTAGERGMGLSTFAEQIAALPAGQLWRHNQAGDLPGDGDRIDSEAFGQITGANRGRRGFTYTHYPIRVEDGAKDAETAYHNRVQIIAANVAGFTVNLSANNVEHADQLADAVGDAAPVVTVLPSTVEGPEHIETPAGRRVVVCPATYRDDVSCASCGLCQRSRNRAIVGFPAHGASKRKADRTAALSNHPNKRAA
jgi:hypothetical protein